MTKAHKLALWCLVNRVCRLPGVAPADRQEIRRLAMEATFGEAADAAAHGDRLLPLDAVLDALAADGVRWSDMAARVNRRGRATCSGKLIDRDPQPRKAAG